MFQNSRQIIHIVDVRDIDFSGTWFPETPLSFSFSAAKFDPTSSSFDNALIATENQKRKKDENSNCLFILSEYEICMCKMKEVGYHSFASSSNMCNQFSSNKKANTHMNPVNFKREKNECIFIVEEDRRVFNRENVPKAIP
ncbi:hypothetical protein T10_701 [Trichinella papuae]|uniref:Uncharacterized protein n=1 Tax=Trichinella papuae TaxID=268474 RepID=A0A0V1MW86_9BILA|nr:hypothetical protein T10_701 [Trichinella papuae]